MRKIFSKFKKTNTSNDLTCLLPDLERGLEGGNTTPRGSTLLLSPTKGRPHTRALSMSTYPHAQCPRAQVPTCPHAHMPTCPRAMLYTAIRLIPGRVSLAKVKNLVTLCSFLHVRLKCIQYASSWRPKTKLTTYALMFPGILNFCNKFL